MNEEKYLDPKTNPMIRPQAFGDDFSDSGDDNPAVDLESPIPLPDKDGLFPGERKEEPIEKKEEPIEERKTSGGEEKLASNLNRIKSLMKGQTRYPVHSAQDEFLYDLVADGDNILIENAAGQRREIRAEEVAAINAAISRELLRRNSDNRIENDTLEKDISVLMRNAGAGSYEIAVEDGEAEPLFRVIKTADGELKFETPEGETKNINDLTPLERKLIRHDLKTRRGAWGGK